MNPTNDGKIETSLRTTSQHGAACGPSQGYWEGFLLPVVHSFLFLNYSKLLLIFCLATASYRLLVLVPHIKITKSIPFQLAQKFRDCFSSGQMHEVSVDEQSIRKNPVSQEVLRHPEFADSVELSRVRDYVCPSSCVSRYHWHLCRLWLLTKSCSFQVASNGTRKGRTSIMRWKEYCRKQSGWPQALVLLVCSSFSSPSPSLTRSILQVQLEV
jgi:hypothetical protein